MIQFTRAAASSPDTLMVSAVLAENNDELIYQPAARVFQYEHRNEVGRRWFHDDFDLSVQDIVYIHDSAITPPARHFSLLGAEGDVYHIAKPEHYVERIEGAGTANPGSKFYGKVLTLRQLAEHLYACGDGGQIYLRRGRDEWKMLTDSLLFDPDFHQKLMAEAPDFNDPSYLEWMIDAAQNPKDRNILFFDINGLSGDAIFLCGVVGPGSKPVLCFWDGKTLEELKVPLAEAALTGIHIENEDSVWICGREGVILHGSRNRGFSPIAARTGLNLFHMITAYRGKLVLPASVRPGGLYQLDPETGEFGRFDPPLPRLKSRDNPDSIAGGPFFAQGIGDVLWVVAEQDVFRFDGNAWERIEHPDL